MLLVAGFMGHQECVSKCAQENHVRNTPNATIALMEGIVKSWRSELPATIPTSSFYNRSKKRQNLFIKGMCIIRFGGNLPFCKLPKQLEHCGFSLATLY